MASVAQVEAVLGDLLARTHRLDPGTRALLPARRTVEARCPDIDLVRFAEWRDGDLIVFEEPPSRRPDIRVTVHSDDLLAIAEGRMSFARAYTANRIRVDAPIADLLRLRALL